MPLFPDSISLLRLKNNTFYYRAQPKIPYSFHPCVKTPPLPPPPSHGLAAHFFQPWRCVLVDATTEHIHEPSGSHATRASAPPAAPHGHHAPRGQIQLNQNGGRDTTEVHCRLWTTDFSHDPQFETEHEENSQLR